MRKSSLAIAAAFVLISLYRVGTFSSLAMKTGWLGWVFSIALGCGVFVSAYWTRVSLASKDGQVEDYKSRAVRQAAWGMLVFFVLADGFFNVVESARVVQPARGDLLMWSATLVWGVVPTVATAGMGALQSWVDRIPAGGHQPPRLTVLVGRWAAALLLGRVQTAEAQLLPSSDPEPAPAVQQPQVVDQQPVFRCQHPGCGYTAKSSKALAGHSRIHSTRSAGQQAPANKTVSVDDTTS